MSVKLSAFGIGGRPAHREAARYPGECGAVGAGLGSQPGLTRPVGAPCPSARSVTRR